MANQEKTRIIETTARMHMCLMSAREGMRLKESEGVRYHDMKPHVPQHEEANDDDVYENFLHLSRPRKDLMLGDDEGVDIPTNPKSKSAKGYIARQRVSISGLISDVSLNGRQGTLVEWSDKTQRWLVNVDEKEDFVPVSVKPANLELVRPGPDKPRYWPAGVHIRELVFDIGSHPPVAKLARRETGGEDEVNGNAETADERPLTDEELGSRVLFSGALIDLRGEFKLATVVSLYSRKAYEGEDWEAEKFHLQQIQKGLSPQHWSAHVGAMANNGRVVMRRCENMGDTMYCGREPRRHGWLEYEPEMAFELPLKQSVGRVLHETWTPQNDEKLWTVKDLCEVVLSRYRKKRTPSFKPGSWLFGARARIACDDDEDDPDPENLSTRLTLSKHCGDGSWGAWAICGSIAM
jgi:hypothetical protein